MVRGIFLSVFAVAGLSFQAHNTFAPGAGFSKANLRAVSQDAFRKGEYLEYDASYGFLDAAKATLKIEDNPVKINGRNTYHVVGNGETQGTFSWFFDVEDRYETYIDQTALIPWKFVRRVHEGGYKLERDILFNHYDTSAVVQQKNKSDVKYKIEPNAQDLLSAFYYARSLNLQASVIGQTYTIQTFFDRENYPMRIKFLGREEVETDLGTFKCLKFRPLLQEGRVFKEEEDMTIWISDDKNKVPIRLETNLLIGSMKMDLVDYKNLVAPLNEIDD